MIEAYTAPQLRVLTRWLAPERTPKRRKSGTEDDPSTPPGDATGAEGAKESYSFERVVHPEALDRLPIRLATSTSPDGTRRLSSVFADGVSIRLLTTTSKATHPAPQNSEDLSKKGYSGVEHNAVIDCSCLTAEEPTHPRGVARSGHNHHTEDHHDHHSIFTGLRDGPYLLQLIASDPGNCKVAQSVTAEVRVRIEAGTIVGDTPTAEAVFGLKSSMSEAGIRDAQVRLQPSMTQITSAEYKGLVGQAENEEFEVARRGVLGRTAYGAAIEHIQAVCREGRDGIVGSRYSMRVERFGLYVDAMFTTLRARAEELLSIGRSIHRFRAFRRRRAARDHVADIVAGTESLDVAKREKWRRRMSGRSRLSRDEQHRLRAEVESR